MARPDLPPMTENDNLMIGEITYLLKDIRALKEKVQPLFQGKTGVQLEPEIRVLMDHIDRGLSVLAIQIQDKGQNPERAWYIEKYCRSIKGWRPEWLKLK